MLGGAVRGGCLLLGCVERAIALVLRISEGGACDSRVCGWLYDYRSIPRMAI